MRPDQAARLAEIQELLIEVCLLEADPRNWPGYGKMPEDLSREERGDATWVRKAAVQAFMVKGRLDDMQDRHLGRTTADPKAQEARDSELDAGIKKYEKVAAQALARVQAGLSK